MNKREIIRKEVKRANKLILNFHNSKEINRKELDELVILLENIGDMRLYREYKAIQLAVNSL